MALDSKVTSQVLVSFVLLKCAKASGKGLSKALIAGKRFYMLFWAIHFSFKCFSCVIVAKTYCHV